MAGFVQAGNLFRAEARPDGPWLRLTAAGGIELTAVRSSAAAAGGVVWCMVRPEKVTLSAAAPAGQPPGTTVLEGAVRQVADLGPLVRVTADCGGVEFLASMGHREYHGARTSLGGRVFLVVAAEDVHVMEQ